MRFRPRRPLGKTGFVASIVGAGDVADASLPFDECVGVLRRALDAGVNVVDTAPQYEDGLSERIVGAAVRDRRDAVFVVDKIDQLDAPVGPQVDASLARLGLSSCDAFVFHGVRDLDRWRSIDAGPMRELADVVASGRARFRGISSHHPDVCLAALRSGTCDVLLFPIGPFVDRRYEDEVLPLARTLGVGTICFKTFAAGMLVADTDGYGRPSTMPGDAPRLTVDECVAYTTTLDPDVALLGLSNAAEQIGYNCDDGPQNTNLADSASHGEPRCHMFPRAHIARHRLRDGRGLRLRYRQRSLLIQRRLWLPARDRCREHAGCRRNSTG